MSSRREGVERGIYLGIYRDNLSMDVGLREK